MDNKKICISGTNNRYMMKKVTKEPVVEKKRVGNVELNFEDKDYLHEIMIKDRKTYDNTPQNF